MITKEAKKVYDEQYRKTDMYKKSQRKYMSSKKGKVTKQQYHLEHILKHRKYQKDYRLSEEGNLIRVKHQAKRERNLGFTPLMSNPFPQEIDIDYHHINNIFVIPIPRQVHKNMLGKNHRVKVNNWIEEVIGDIGVY